MKNIIKILILLTICVLLGLWSPWVSWNIDLAGLFDVETPDEISGLQVSSLIGELEVKVDGEIKGTITPENSPLFIAAVDPGERQIEIRRLSSFENAYWKFNQNINFVTGVDVVISLGLGPSQIFSEGTIISATKKTNENYNLVISANTDDPSISINTIGVIGQNNQVSDSLTLDRQHLITVSKNGYETLEFRVFPAEQEERDKIKDYVVNVETILMLQPVRLEVR